MPGHHRTRGVLSAAVVSSNSAGIEDVVRRQYAAQCCEWTDAVPKSHIDEEP